VLNTGIKGLPHRGNLSPFYISGAIQNAAIEISVEDIREDQRYGNAGFFTTCHPVGIHFRQNAALKAKAAPISSL
jgi:hypothetical protein